MFRRGDPKFGEAVRALLLAMSAGGIYDHLGGGYARYSTDAEWLVPHFEKMLYDNAQILELLALRSRRRTRPGLRRARPRDGRLADARNAGRGRLRRLAGRRPGRRGRRVLRLDGAGDRRRARSRPPRASRRPTTSRRGGNWEGRTVLRRITPRGSAGGGGRPRAARAKHCSRCARGAPSPDGTTRFWRTGTA